MLLCSLSINVKYGIIDRVNMYVYVRVCACKANSVIQEDFYNFSDSYGGREITFIKIGNRNFIHGNLGNFSSIM